MKFSKVSVFVQCSTSKQNEKFNAYKVEKPIRNFKVFGIACTFSHHEILVVNQVKNKNNLTFLINNINNVNLCKQKKNNKNYSKMILYIMFNFWFSLQNLLRILSKRYIWESRAWFFLGMYKKITLYFFMTV